MFENNCHGKTTIKRLYIKIFHIKILTNCLKIIQSSILPTINPDIQEKWHLFILKHHSIVFYFYYFGVLLVVTSLYSLSNYIFDFSLLSEYGKGYFTGKVILLVSGILLILFSMKKTTLSKTGE